MPDKVLPIPSTASLNKTHAIHNFDRVPTIVGLNQIDYYLTHDRMLVTKETFNILKQLICGHKTISLWSRSNWLETHLSKYALSIRSFDDPGTTFPNVYGEVNYEEFNSFAKREFQSADLILLKNGSSDALHQIYPYLLKSHLLLTYTDLGGIVKEGWKSLREVDELNAVQIRWSKDTKHKWVFCRVDTSIPKDQL
jgi:hypothetical protein